MLPCKHFQLAQWLLHLAPSSPPPKVNQVSKKCSQLRDFSLLKMFPFKSQSPVAARCKRCNKVGSRQSSPLQERRWQEGQEKQEQEQEELLEKTQEEELEKTQVKPCKSYLPLLLVFCLFSLQLFLPAFLHLGFGRPSIPLHLLSHNFAHFPLLMHFAHVAYFVQLSSDILPSLSVEERTKDLLPSEKKVRIFFVYAEKMSE